MHAHELTIGRRFGVTFEHGEDFFATLRSFCSEHQVHSAFVPMFIAGFAQVELVGTCEPVDDPHAPVWERITASNVEVVGSGTIATTNEGAFSPHIHVAIGKKLDGAGALMSHLLDAKVLFLAEILIIEVVTPPMTRTPDPQLYDVPLLRFGDA